MAPLSLAAELDFARIAPLKVSIVRRLLHKHGMPSNWMVEDRCHLVPKIESYVPFSRPGLAWPLQYVYRTLGVLPEQRGKRQA